MHSKVMTRPVIFGALSLTVLLTAGLAQIRNISAASPKQGTAEVKNFNPPLTLDNQGPAPRGGRMMLVTKGPVTDSTLAILKNYATIHGVIRRYNLVALTPRSPAARTALTRLSFVALVESDLPRYLTDVGSWDRDIMDVVDVQESGLVGDPDPREVSYTGAGVHVALIDTGLVKNWRDFLIAGRVRADLARAFMGGGAVAENFVSADEFNISNPTNLWERDTNSHGLATASHVIGFKVGAQVVDGVAPGAKIIPMKVFPNGEAFTWSSRIIAAFAYTTALKENGIGPMVVSMSISGGAPGYLERIAIDDAINAGVIVVTSAGNQGEQGMGWPAAFPEVISAGAVGWTRQFLPGSPSAPNSSFWWNQDVGNDPDGSGASEETEAYVADFSSRAIPSLGTAFGTDPQELDVLAPGVWTVAPGSHGPTAGYFFWSGTSFSTPLTAGVAALMLEKNPALVQGTVESILKSTALPMAGDDTRTGVLEPLLFGTFFTPSWDTDCAGEPCDPVGAGLVQADAALAATP
ncbi:MAG: S8 family serine peptidase [Terriglobia bacterium]